MTAPSMNPSWPLKPHDRWWTICRSHPQPHIAFILDGNRRYAKKHNLKEGDGHRAGFIYYGSDAREDRRDAQGREFREKLWCEGSFSGGFEALAPTSQDSSGEGNESHCQ
uniref:Uncharacterized protein n=1 Tax=Nelumbo nucifera TaxID=4432 RepID=A0A822ZNB4_NELNU|nr:TPA_asm: hypothetical protein HUJ06_003261 [Nelumbo nucifera]